MAWKNKYQRLAQSLGMAPSAHPAGPSVAPVGLAQPAQAIPSMASSLKPQGVPAQAPAVPQLMPHPSFSDHEIKQKALRNIATGRKGF